MSYICGSDEGRLLKKNALVFHSKWARRHHVREMLSFRVFSFKPCGWIFVFLDERSHASSRALFSLLLSASLFPCIQHFQRLFLKCVLWDGSKILFVGDLVLEPSFPPSSIQVLVSNLTDAGNGEMWSSTVKPHFVSWFCHFKNCNDWNGVSWMCSNKLLVP